MRVLDTLLGRTPTAPQRYVQVLMGDPPADEVRWLGSLVAEGEEDRALWELRYAWRAVGLMVAQRDALDDRTASLVARELEDAMRADRAVAAPMLRLAERQLNERLGAYRDMAAMRGTDDAVAERLGRTLLLLSGVVKATSADGERAAQLMAGFFAKAAEALRAAFGGPSPAPTEAPTSNR